MNTTETTIDSAMRDMVNRQLVKWATGHVMICPHCGNILDCRSTVVAGRNTGDQRIMCGPCWDKQPDHFAYSEIVDGRKLWAPPAPRVKKPKAKHTFRERIERGLQVTGWVRDWADRSRYAAWTKPGATEKRFTGVNGALRQGECASRSYSIGDPCAIRGVYAELLKVGDDALYLDAHAK